MRSRLFRLERREAVRVALHFARLERPSMSQVESTRSTIDHPLQRRCDNLGVVLERRTNCVPRSNDSAEEDTRCEKVTGERFVVRQFNDERSFSMPSGMPDGAGNAEALKIQRLRPGQLDIGAKRAIRLTNQAQFQEESAKASRGTIRHRRFLPIVRHVACVRDDRRPRKLANPRRTARMIDMRVCYDDDGDILDRTLVLREGTGDALLRSRQPRIDQCAAVRAENEMAVDHAEWKDRNPMNGQCS